MTTRTVTHSIEGRRTSDGNGVKLTRSIGSTQELRVDPFLMLDEFASDDAADYIGGFPSHPHRGFETVTYMLDGHMLHEDHMGNRGDLRPGDVQWMTAGRGIIHSEMPRQSEGRMRGFQLWINLPAAEKMKPAAYRDVAAAQIPVVGLPGGGSVRVIAGTLSVEDRTTEGPINAGAERLSTNPFYFDVELPADTVFTHAVELGYNAFLYVFEGSASVQDRPLQTHSAGVFSDGERVDIASGPAGARFLLLAGKPLNEPVVQYGPFVMNTREEIEQAKRDYASGALTSG